MSTILSESFAPEIRAILDSHGLALDPAFMGEIQRLTDRPGIRRRYVRRAGLTIDALGELIADRRIVSERPTCREVLDLLDVALAPEAGVSVRKQPARAAVDAAERKARQMRLRKLECDCGALLRGTRQSLARCGRCGAENWSLLVSLISSIVDSDQTARILRAIDELIPVMRRVDPLPEEVLAMGGAV